MNDPINGGDGDSNTDGMCQNGGVCIDWTHNTAYLPRCVPENPDCFTFEPGDAPDWLVAMFPDANPHYLKGYDNVLLPQDEMMCGCNGKPGSPPQFSGRFCSCTSIDELLASCSVQQAHEGCANALQVMDNELSVLCHISELTASGSAATADGTDISTAQCSMACANLFSPFFSVCGGDLWPSEDPLGNPLPTSGPVYDSLKAQGVDVVLNNKLASFNQQCAVAGGREDGQVDYCIEKPVTSQAIKKVYDRTLFSEIDCL